MKLYAVLLLSILSYAGFAQNNYIVKTEDGRRVLLKADYTWEYIDLEAPKQAEEVLVEAGLEEAGCNVPADFEEPKLNGKVQNQLKKGRATIDDVKKKVAKDYNCTVDEVILLWASERKSNGKYTFCANGTKVTYKRNGFVIIENGKLF